MDAEKMKILIVCIYGLVCFLPYACLSLYPFSNRLRFSLKGTALICILWAAAKEAVVYFLIQAQAGGWLFGMHWICGIPFMLYLTKVKKFGMVSLTGIILGLLNLVMGSGVLVLIFGIIFGVLGDVILRAGKYQSWKCTLLGNGVFSLWIMGYVSRMFLTRDTFFASLVSSYGQEYVDTLMSYTPGWMYPVLFVVTFIGGILGALLGKAVLKKHFEKAGIA